jgi:hypothetical protein
MIHEYYSLTCEWRGATALRFSSNCESVTFSPEIIWREIASFSFSTSIAFHEVFPGALIHTSSRACGSILSGNARGVNPVLCEHTVRCTKPAKMHGLHYGGE